MSKKTKKRGLAALIASAMMAMMIPTSSGAETIYTAVAGGSCNFNKYLIMDAGDNVPNVSFSFTVAPGTAIPADLTSDTKTMEVLAGIGTPTIDNVTFADEDATSTTALATQIDVQRAASDRATGLDAATGVQFESGEKFAVKTATVNFAGITFDEPGVYRYIISETASTAHEAAGIMHDNDTDRVLDVYVTDNGNGVLAVSSYVMHKTVGPVIMGANNGSGDVNTDSQAVVDKTDGFTNEYNSKDLVFKKEVTGNQASRDKWFKFTATLTNVNDDDIFTVSRADDSNANTTDGNADATVGTTSATKSAYQGKSNPASVTGEQLKAGVDFYLQHGQSIAIRGIAPNATYVISEDAEDYKSTPAGVMGYTDVVSSVTENKTIGDIANAHTGDGAQTKAVMTSFLNTRDGVIPTGILLSVGPWVLLGIVVIGGVIFFAVRSKKKYDEE